MDVQRLAGFATRETNHGAAAFVRSRAIHHETAAERAVEKPERHVQRGGHASAAAGHIDGERLSLRFIQRARGRTGGERELHGGGNAQPAHPEVAFHDQADQLGGADDRVLQHDFLLAAIGTSDDEHAVERGNGGGVVGVEANGNEIPRVAGHAPERRR